MSLFDSSLACEESKELFAEEDVFQEKKSGAPLSKVTPTRSVEGASLVWKGWTVKCYDSASNDERVSELINDGDAGRAYARKTLKEQYAATSDTTIARRAYQYDFSNRSSIATFEDNSRKQKGRDVFARPKPR